MNDKALYVFDLDDTLIESVKLNDVITIHNGQIKSENENTEKYIEKIKNFFLTMFYKEICFKKSGDFVVVFDKSSKKLLGSEYINYIQDLVPEKLSQMGVKNSVKKDMLRSIEEKDGMLVLQPFPGFYDAESTIGKEVNPEVFSVYKSAKNKMVLTGRRENIRQYIKNVFAELGVEMPNCGLNLFPGGNKSILEYKTKVIEDAILGNGWKEVHFFEDNSKWLDKVAAEIKSKFPDVEFKKHLITNIKSKLTL